jgi:hypothetical protein
MDDPVLHRKFFREKALRLGDLKPRRYQLGAGPTGVAPITPEGPTYNPYTTKTVDGKVYSLDRMGNVVKIDYLPATVNQPQGGMSKLFQGLEAIVDPASASERGTYRKIGQTIFNPKTYTEGIPALVKGAGRIAKSIPGYAVVEEGIDRIIPDTGNALADTGINIGALGASQYALGAKQAAKYAGRSLLTRAGISALASPAVLAGVLNPYALGAAAVATPFIAADYLSKERMKNDPVYAAQIEKQRIEGIPGEPTMDPDTSQMMYGTPQKLNLKEVTPQGGGTGTGGTPPGGTPPAGSDFSNMGGVTQPLVTPAGTVKPLGDFQPKEETITSGLEDTSKKLSAEQKGLTTPKGQVKEPGVFDKLGDFARTASGNAFLLKFAAGLLSGKGTFGEVVGNALNPAVDLFAAYRLKEQELSSKLMEAQLKAIKDSKANVDMASGNFPFQDKDGTITYVPAVIDKKSLSGYYMVGDKKYAIPENQVNLFSEKAIKADASTLKNIGKLGENLTANALINDLVSQGPSTKGTAGLVRYTFERFSGVAGALREVAKEVEFKDVYDELTGKLVTGDKAKEVRNRIKDIDSNIAKIDALNKKESDPKTQDILVRNKVDGVTLKYFLANAFKDEDRLTNRDLEYINDITNILAGTVSGKDIDRQLVRIQDYLTSRRKNIITQIRSQGFDDYSITRNMFGETQGALALGYLQSSPSIGGKQSGAIDFKSKSTTDINKLLQNSGIQ